MNHAKECLDFINQAPSVFHGVEEMKKRCLEKGFVLLSEGEKWHLEKGKSYVVVRNMSSIIAFHIGQDMQDIAYNICASHSDSPVYKLKNMAEIKDNHYLRLASEGYGGMINSSWLDRPLSIAGRVCVKTEKGMEMRLFDTDKNLCIIPNMPIHMCRDINNGFKYQMHVDMVPLLGEGKSEMNLKGFVAKELHVQEEDIIGSDLYLVNHTPASFIGLNDEFVGSGKIDNLMSAYATLTAFLETENEQRINLFACFDNEEVGSLTRQGADSTLLEDVLMRIGESLGYTMEEMRVGAHHSMMLSVDNAHAAHPNHPEVYDPTFRCYMNEGVVIKGNANQRYTNDGITAAFFEQLCRRNDIPVQYYFNRSDMPGGSTLGNLAMAHVNIKSVDIGLAQLAMHSSYELAGSRDVEYMVKACEAFYASCCVDKDNTLEF